MGAPAQVINNTVHYVEGDASAPGNSNFENLLDWCETNSIDAVIQLGPGYHQLTFTDALELSQNYVITGAGKRATLIHVNSTDPDCFLDFTGCVEMSSLTIYGDALTSANLIELNGDDSVLRDLVMDVDNDHASLYSVAIAIYANGVTVERVRFEGEFPADEVLLIGDGSNACTGTLIRDCWFGSATGATYGCASNTAIWVAGLVYNCNIEHCHWYGYDGDTAGFRVGSNTRGVNMRHCWFEMYPEDTSDVYGRAIYYSGDTGVMDGHGEVYKCTIHCAQTGDYYQNGAVELNQKVNFHHNKLFTAFFGYDDHLRGALVVESSAEWLNINDNHFNCNYGDGSVTYMGGCAVYFDGAIANLTFCRNEIVGCDLDTALGAVYGLCVKFDSIVTAAIFDQNQINFSSADITSRNVTAVGDDGSALLSWSSCMGNVFEPPSPGTYAGYCFRSASLNYVVATGNICRSDNTLSDAAGSNIIWGDGGTTLPGSNQQTAT